MATESSLKIPPQNMDAEMALIGSIMLRSEAIYEVIDIVSPTAFYSRKHRYIFEAIQDLFKKNNPIDLLSVSARLKEKNKFDEIGGGSYLAEILNSVPTAINVRHYGEIVKNKFIMRRLIEASEHIRILGYEEESDLEDILDRAEKKVFEITSSGGNFKFTEIKNELEEAWERLDMLHNSKGEMRGIATGFPDIDHKLAGLQKSDLIILAARPSMGKTSLALDIARQTAVGHGNAVGIFSLEMSSQQLVDRMLAAEANVDAWKLRTGKLSREEDFASIRQSLDKLSSAPIYIDDQPGNNILKMRAVARRLKAEKDLKLIIVDYLQLMLPSGSRSNENLVQQVTEISRSLKNLARELDVPVLALSQLSRAVESRGGKPRLSDLRDSGCLAGDTLITRADTGERMMIKNLVGKTNIPVISFNEKNHKLEQKIISNVFKSGSKQIFEIKTSSGQTIKASANHPFFTIGGWKRLDNLTLNEHIATPRQIDINRSNSKIPQEELAFLAHLIGDGCILPRQPYHYTSADRENIEFMEKTAEKLFGIKTKRVKQKNLWHVYFTSPYRLTKGKYHPITLWFKKIGMNCVRSYDKFVPESIFESNKKDIGYFLHHLWATDGNISIKNMAGRKPSGAIYYASSSYTLTKNVKDLLLRLGIIGNLRQSKKGGYRTMYQVHIESSDMQKRFCETVGSFGKRGKIIKKLLSFLNEIIPNPNNEVIPQGAWKLFVEPAKEEAGMSWRKFAQDLGVAYNGTAILRNGISRNRLTEIASVLSSVHLNKMAESDIYWDKIVSIEELGEEEVYDATVPENHNFVANDFILHNSIEQDADVVMFIHRDDKYKDESERTNIAEILIEKHRNGETGKVDLYFNDKKATFQSITKENFGGAEKEFSDF